MRAAKKITPISPAVTVPEPPRVMKTLADIQTDMSMLYEEVRAGEVELKLAAELANIAGKYLKAEQLKLAREVFVANRMGSLHEDAAALVAKD